MSENNKMKTNIRILGEINIETLKTFKIYSKTFILFIIPPLNYYLNNGGLATNTGLPSLQ